ncbi:unnamed protein product [Rotaria sordida]|uniref:Uncharacterized protein n=1 Tax=Rotaria sordida TaxID=392033 RepID=A0A814PKU9_9BILA|nr:unnamed protein product [Rotaria sordida]CAF3650831.1 unnamed protein product [Rotaria sordida]
MAYVSLLVLLGPSNILEDFNQKDFLHPSFFIHCVSDDECKNTLERYQNNVLEMDIVLPDTAIDLIRTYQNLICPRKSFHIYCQTKQRLQECRQLHVCCRYDSVFNMNMLQQKLERRAQNHLLRHMEYLENLKEQGNADAADSLILIGETFEQNAARINEEIRQKSSLGTQSDELDNG